MRCLGAVAVLVVSLAIGARAQEIGPDSMSAGARFHFESGFDDDGFRTLHPGWGRQVPLYKTYAGAPKVSLPQPVDDTLPVCVAIHRRASVRSFLGRELPLAVLGRVLQAADGLTTQAEGHVRRAAPSAGGLYPIEIYVVASDVESLTPGLYHFQVRDSTLERLSEEPLAELLHQASNEQRAVGSSPATIILTARFDRVTTKYADRGYRYAYIEAGAVCENIYLQAAALGLGTVVVGAFNDAALSRVLQIDGVREAPIVMMPVGYPAGP